MIPHPRVLLEQLDPAQVEDVYRASLRILDETGLAIALPEAVRALADAGARVDGGRVRLGPDLVERLVGRAPRRFTLHGRTPARSVEVGSGSLLVSPGYGSPSVADAAGRRRDATMADFERFAALAGAADAIDITGGLLVEPLDVPPALRPLEITRSLLERSDKPFLGSVAGTAGARESLDLARVVFGTGSADFDGRAVMMGLVNVNSPLRLDDRMAEALIEYAPGGAGGPSYPGHPHGRHRARHRRGGARAGGSGTPRVRRARPGRQAGFARRHRHGRVRRRPPHRAVPASAGPRTRSAPCSARRWPGASGCRSAVRAWSRARACPTTAAATSA